MPHPSEQHAQHDPLLVVAFTAGDLTGADRESATTLIATCADCAALHDDLIAIAQATAALPPAARTHEFTLTPDQAARLRPAGWRRFVAAFTSPQLAITRQLGVGLTTLGLAGLLFSVLPSMSLSLGSGSAGAAPALAPAPAAGLPGEDALSSGDAMSRGAAVEAGPSRTAVPAASAKAQFSANGGSPAPVALGPASSPYADQLHSDRAGTNGYGGAAVPEPAATPDTAGDQRLLSTSEDRPGPSPLVVTSVILLGAGLALLLARRVARRIAAR